MPEALEHRLQLLAYRLVPYSRWGHGCIPSNVRRSHHKNLPNEPLRNTVVFKIQMPVFFKSYPCAEAVILALLITGDVVVWVAFVPSKFILFMTWHVDVLKVSIRLLSIAGSTFDALWSREGVGSANKCAKALN